VPDIGAPGFTKLGTKRSSELAMAVTGDGRQALAAFGCGVCSTEGAPSVVLEGSRFQRLQGSEPCVCGSCDGFSTARSGAGRDVRAHMGDAAETNVRAVLARVRPHASR
jgi:hypothetical protein